jgi:hypothetical protein
MPNARSRRKGFFRADYIDKSFAERLRVDYKDLSKSIGALASKLRSQQ